jgi:hypothetical protein
MQRDRDRAGEPDAQAGAERPLGSALEGAPNSGRSVVAAATTIQ